MRFADDIVRFHQLPRIPSNISSLEGTNRSADNMRPIRGSFAVRGGGSLVRLGLNTVLAMVAATGVSLLTIACGPKVVVARLATPTAEAPRPPATATPRVASPTAVASPTLRPTA